MSAETQLRVSGTTDPGKLAKSIAMTLVEGNGKVKVRAMGPHAVNQATKGIIVARQQLAAQAKDLKLVPGFDTQREGDDDVTVIVYHISLTE